MESSVVEYVLRNRCYEILVVESLFWNICCGVFVVFLLWIICCGIFVVESLLNLILLRSL